MVREKEQGIQFQSPTGERTLAFPMEHSEATEGLYEDTVAGALARRKLLLGTDAMSGLETMQQQVLMANVKATQAHAIDKSTAQELFRQRFPGHQGLNIVTATAAGSLMFENGLIAYLLPNGDWVEPMNGHYVHASSPWARMLMKELQWHIDQESKSQGTPEETSPEKPVEPQTGLFAGAIAKVLGRAG